MFGLTDFFAALKRLTRAVNHSAELFEGANGQLEARLGIDESIDEADAIPDAVADNGRKRLTRAKAAV